MAGAAEGVHHVTEVEVGVEEALLYEGEEEVGEEMHHT